jgi:lipopolysaccharide export system protein LptC
MTDPSPPPSSPPAEGASAELARLRFVAAAGRDTRLAWDDSHSRLVSRAKLVLPALALLVLVVVIAWPMIERRGNGTAPSDSGQLEMVDARYRSEDDKARPFEVRAERAIRSSSQSKLVDLLKPEAEMTLESGSWITISADKGKYDQQSGQLSLSGHVTLYHDQGYEFLTETAQVDTNAGTAWGDARVTGQGPFGDIDAAGFRIMNEGKTLVFTGKARLVLPNPGGSRSAQPSGRG